MRPFARGLAVLSTTLLLAACGAGSGATAAPTTAGGGGATTPPAATGAAGGSGTCAPASGTGTVTASIENRTFTPGTINAKVGDVISWTNGDSVPHGVALDSDSTKCTDSISGGGTGSTSFSAAGTYAFHCFVHPSMKGTVVVS